MLFRSLIVLASLLLILKGIDMASIYQKAYNKLLQQESDTSYPARVDKSAPPICMVFAETSTVYSLGEADSLIVEAV